MKTLCLVKSALSALHLLSSSQVRAFITPRTTSTSPPSLRTHRPLFALHEDFTNESPHSINHQQADSVTRRRLVFSLLATSSLPLSAGATPAQTPSATVASTSFITTESTEDRVLRPPLDKRQYETYTLPNGLKVLLCSDPTSTAAAVGLNVHVGACSDPVEIPGLVRFFLCIGDANVVAIMF